VCLCLFYWLDLRHSVFCFMFLLAVFSYKFFDDRFVVCDSLSKMLLGDTSSLYF
jgi:hypothetical protein